MNAPPRMRYLWLALAYASLGLAAAGVVLPGLPTTPFVLLAAWCASRGSPALRARLESHPRYGRIIRDWHQHGAVPRPAKRLAIAMMALSWLLLAWMTRDWRIMLGLFLLFVTVGSWLLRRPEKGPHAEAGKLAVENRQDA